MIIKIIKQQSTIINTNYCCNIIQKVLSHITMSFEKNEKYIGLFMFLGIQNKIDTPKYLIYVYGDIVKL